MGIGERLLTGLGFSAMGGLGMGFNMMVMLSALENWEIEWWLVAASGIGYTSILMAVSYTRSTRREIKNVGSKGIGIAMLLCPVATYMHGVLFPVPNPIFPMWFWAIFVALFCWPAAVAFLRTNMFASGKDEEAD